MKFGRQRLIDQFDEKGNWIALYFSVKDAAKSIGCYPTYIAVCMKKNWKIKGYFFRYATPGSLDRWWDSI